jgi:metallophosphoesterase (TIGR00282 family)
MNILFIGDVVGRPGRKLIKNHLSSLREEFKIDYVIANYENMAHGFGITPKIYKEMKNNGVDIFTGGNHTFDKKKEAVELLEKELILRPLNYFEAPGKWYYEDENLVVISVMGIFSMPYGKNPFIELNQVVDKFKDKFIFIDFHAEATAEKRALFHLLKGRVGAIVGTHTHVGTDDLEIEDGTTYLTDIGLTGCRDNIIGMEIDGPIKHMLTGLKPKYDVPNSCDSIMQVLVIECDGVKSKRAMKIKIDKDGKRVVQEAIN